MKVIRYFREVSLLKTSWREITGALAGATIGAIIPIALHILAARSGNAEMMGMPLAALSLPGFFIGAIGGALFARRDK